MNVLTPDKKSTIITLLKNGISQREISRKAKIHRKTVRRYANESGLFPANPDLDSKYPTLATGPDCITIQNTPPWPPGNSVSKEEKRAIPLHARSACEPHREWIEDQVRLGRNGVSIYQDLVELFGFTNKYNSVKRFVRGLKKEDPKQFDRLEFLPGEEAQVDYGQGAKTLHSTGKYRKPRLFVMTLKFSRRSFRKVVWKSSKETWAKLHEQAFRYFGGCTQYVVLDNLKEGVIKPDIYEPELNAVYAAMLDHYGVIADPARVLDPNRKGTVENAIQHTQDTALKGRTFESIERQNEWLMHWEERWAAPRIHGRAKRQVEQMFQEEKPYLKQLPLSSFKYFSQETRTVWDDGMIQVGKSYYSALPVPLHTKVIIRIYDTEIEVIDPVTMEVIRRHVKSNRPGFAQMEPGDRIFNPSRQTNYLFAKAESIGPSTKKLCKLLFEEEGRPGQRRMQGIVNLVRHYKACYIEEAAIKAIKVDLRNYKSIRNLVKTLAENNQREKEKDSDRLIQEHKLIRPPEDYAAFWEQHAAQTEVGEQSPAGSERVREPSRFIMPREQLPKIWQSASWEKVIEVFGLEVDEKRHSKPEEIWIKSPFTGENTASLHLNLTENIFKDFSSGLGAKVGVLNFCQDLLGLRGQAMNCYEVASWMMERGISAIDSPDTRSQVVKRHVQLSKEPEENKPIRVDLRPWLQSGHPELQRRQASEATCGYLGCGFLPERAEGSPLNGRLVFQVRGVSELKPVILTHVGRALTPQQEKTDGKYWSFPFFKKLEIYNQDKLLLDPKARQQVERFGLVLVEGFFDVAALIESGCLNIGALMGSHMTEEQMARVKFISSHIPIPKVTVFLDRDEAGIAGTEKAIALLRTNGFSAEAFDWNQTFERSGADLVKIPVTIRDPGDMSVKQLQWLRRQGRI
ncbi:MAG: IS21 family transposase [Thermodesulfobacteriota bacterium]|nr:IS21 family transposase [Thermodesulfobacteriota bacterium]